MTDTDRSPPKANAFWDFSLALYADESVQRACIELQDGAGVDVNVMLYVMWLATRGQTLSDADMHAILEVVEPWKASVVVPLRTARRNLKQPPAAFAGAAAQALRAVVKKAELEAERLQQSTLFALRPAGDPVPTAQAVAATTANLQAYGRALGRQLAPAPIGVMVTALQALSQQG